MKPDLPSRAPCKLAFVGEAPADVEVIHGRPLQGPSGNVFNQLLRCANIRREECLVTNVFDVQAPDNEVMSWTHSPTTAREAGWPAEAGYNGRFFDPAFVDPHLKRLAKEIKAARPRLIVPMGSVAMWAFTGAAAVTGARGAMVEASRITLGTKVMPILHPAHIIKDWRMFHVTVSDLLKAVAEADRVGPPLYSKRRILISPSLANIAWFRKNHLAKATVISTDIETTGMFGGQITCIGFAADAANALVIPFTDWRKPSRSYWPTVDTELEAMNHVSEILASPTPKLFQNGPYDVFWLWDKWGMPTMNYCEDTRLLHHALYPELPKALGFMGASYANEGPWKLLRGDKAGKRDE